MKCKVCNGCFNHRIIDNKMYLYCMLCQKYYVIREKQLIDVTDEVRKILER